jgi:hypothetical protein
METMRQRNWVELTSVCALWINDTLFPFTASHYHIFPNYWYIILNILKVSNLSVLSWFGIDTVEHPSRLLLPAVLTQWCWNLWPTLTSLTKAFQYSMQQLTHQQVTKQLCMLGDIYFITKQYWHLSHNNNTSSQTCGTQWKQYLEYGIR